MLLVYVITILKLYFSFYFIKKHLSLRLTEYLERDEPSNEISIFSKYTPGGGGGV